MTGRRATAKRLDEVRTRLTERDFAVLRRVTELRFTTGDQLTRLHYWQTDDAAANGRAARRALLRLTRLGCLDRLPRVVGGVRRGSSGFVYYLGLVGQRLAGELGWLPNHRRRRSISPGTMFLAHTLQIAELHTRLVEADRSGDVELLALTAEPGCWRHFDSLGGQGQTLKPDSFVQLGVGDFVDSYFIEVDRGTEGSRTLDRALAAYVAYRASGQEQVAFPFVLWLTPDERRRQVVEDSIQALPAVERAPFIAARFDQMRSVFTSEKTTAGS